MVADSDVVPVTRVRALVAAGGMTVRQGGDVTSARQQVEEGIDLWRSLGDMRELSSALDALGWMLFFGGQDDVEALSAFDESLDIGRTLGDRGIETRALVGVCQVLIAQGEVERSEVASNNCSRSHAPTGTTALSTSHCTTWRTARSSAATTSRPTYVTARAWRP